MSARHWRTKALGRIAATRSPKPNMSALRGKPTRDDVERALRDSVSPRKPLRINNSGAAAITASTEIVPERVG
jgi:hypothetical protein